MDCFLWALPPEECMAVEMRAPKMPSVLLGALKCALATLDITKQEATKPKQAPGGPLTSTSWANAAP